MRTLLPAFLITTWASAGNATPGVGQESDCVAPSDGARFEFEDPARSTIRLEWRAPGQGARVRLQMSADPEFGRLLIDREVCCETKIRSLDVGRYHWRVVDADSGTEQCRASFEVIKHPRQD